MLQRFAIALSAAGLAMTVACSHSDAGITTAVKAKLAADDTVKAYEINVDTGKGIVTLNGVVDTPAEKARAVVIARNTEGVTDVIDQITVGPAPAATRGEAAEGKIDAAGREISEKAHEGGEAVEDAAHDAKVKTENAASKTGEVITDAAITSEVKTKFLAEPGVSGLNINVDTNSGVVTLTGDVKSKAEADKAIAIARKSAGVKQVINHLHVA